MSFSIPSAGFALVSALTAYSYVIAPATAETHLRSHSYAKTPARDDACALLTKPEAAAALGVAVGAPKAKSDYQGALGSVISTCEYSGPGLEVVQLILTRLTASAAPMYRAMCSQEATKDLAGLGEIACWYNEKHGELHAFKGTVFMSVQLSRSGDPTEAIKGVMKKALERLR